MNHVVVTWSDPNKKRATVEDMGLIFLVDERGYLSLLQFHKYNMFHFYRANHEHLNLWILAVAAGTTKANVRGRASVVSPGRRNMVDDLWEGSKMYFSFLHSP